MQVINFYLVSIFLCCVKLHLGVLGTLSLTAPTTISSSALSSQGINSHKPYLAFNNNHVTFSNYPGFKSNNSSLNSNTLSKTSITAVHRNNSDNFTSQDHINPSAGSFYPDKPGEPGTPSFNLYDATARVMKAVFKTLKSKQEDFENSFTIPNDIVLLATGSMSILHFTKINLDRLSRAFYYIFDVEHMMIRDEHRTTFITNVEKLINDIEYVNAQNPLIDQYHNIDLDNVVKNLKDVLISYRVGNFNYSDIMLNIQLMKGLVLITHSDSKVLNQLISSISKDFLNEVKARQYEIEGSSIAKTHTEVICKTMPGVFSLLLNHIELLKILSTRKLVESDKKMIQDASKFLKNIMFIFINRYKNFGNLSPEKISDLDIIVKLLEKLDTGETVPEIIKDPSEMELGKTQGPIEVVQDITEKPSETDQESPQKSSTPTLDIEELVRLTEQAIAAVLNLAEETDIVNWKKKSVFKFKNFQENQNKEYYIDLLTYNVDTAIVLIGAFEKSFLDEVDYIKFQNKGNDDVFYL